jgi:hypothetical protein
LAEARAAEARSACRLVPMMVSEEAWIRVRAATFVQHRKPGSHPTLRANYCTGAMTYAEFVPFEHPGTARSRAERWWAEMGGRKPTPATVGEAIERAHELDEVMAVAVVRDDRWWRVIARRTRHAEVWS